MKRHRFAFKDGDCFSNRQDNCPTAANGSIASGGPGHRDAERWNLAPAADDGPSSDAIGDVCDSEAGVVTITQNNQSLSITMSDTVANGRYLSATNVVPKCIGGTDADGDGYCAHDREGGQDGPGACGANVGSVCALRHSAWTGAGHPVGAVTMDTDGDRFTDVRETYMNNNGNCIMSATNAFSSVGPACALGAHIPRLDVVQPCAHPGSIGTNNEHPYDNWALDYNDSGNANTLDILTYSARLSDTVDPSFAASGDEGDQRWDIDNNGKINTLDFLGPYSTEKWLNNTCGDFTGGDGPPDGGPLDPSGPPIPAFSQQ